MSQATVEFSAKDPKELYDRFKELVPPYGGTQWFINSALAGFIDALEAEPSLKDRVNASVEAMLQLNRLKKEVSA